MGEIRIHSAQVVKHSRERWLKNVLLDRCSQQTPELVESRLQICDQSVKGAEVETRLVLHAPVPVHAKPESPFSIRAGGILHRSLALKPLAVFPVDRETSIFIPSHAR